MSRYATVDKKLKVWKNPKGYEIWKRKDTGKIVYAHRKLYEMFYGKLQPFEVVHHLKGKANNLNNLTKMHKVEHDKLHRNRREM
jgi:hypothetical protein